jgi:hypothetical protein
VPKPPPRVQWILALSVAALVVVAVVLFVRHENQAANGPAPPINKAAITEENREADIVVSEDQAPHVAVLGRGLALSAGLTSAVTAYMAKQISLGFIDGPIEASKCSPRAGGTATRLVFLCTIEAAYVNYPFDAVITPANRQITYCKRDYPPVPSMNIPVSSRCT